MATVMVTGCAGFIGYHVCRRLAQMGHRVVGIDNFNWFYPPILKDGRYHALAREFPDSFTAIDTDLSDDDGLVDLIAKHAMPSYIVHLAATPGVYPSIYHPQEYIRNNIVGFQRMIDLANRINVINFVYASSSSVYGNCDETPFNEKMQVGKPISLYAATKVSNELVANVYSEMHDMCCTGLRFFTVYGPWGRPDMALWLFAHSIRQGKPITLFGEGKQKRDWTYVDDIVDGVISALTIPKVGHEIVNLGAGNPVGLFDAVKLLAKRLGKKPEIVLAPMQPGDVRQTHADIGKARTLWDYDPKVRLEEGIDRFVSWIDEHQDVFDRVSEEMSGCMSCRKPL